MFRPALQGLLVFVIIGGIGIFFIQNYIQDKTSLKVNDCDHVEDICQNQQIAAKCKALAFCEKRWRDSGFLNNTIDDKRLKMNVYYETICKDSIKFIREQLYPTFERLYASGIFNLMLVPSGNVQRTKKGEHWEFSCQHGEDECLGNIIQACVIYSYPNVTRWLPFVYCMEKQYGSIESAKMCAEQGKMDYKVIEKCTNGPIGKKLQLEMALKTEALRPKHTFIPWITINGKSAGIQKLALDDLTGLLCDMYIGRKPDACD